MQDDTTGKVIAMIFLIAVVVSYFFVWNQKRIGETARNLAMWGLIFVGTFAAVSLWPSIRSDFSQQASYGEDGTQISLPRHGDGHFYMTLSFNGTPIEFLVDTGATDVVLSLEDAQRIGIDTDALSFLGRANTANGEVATARTSVSNVRNGSFDEGRLRVSVNGGEMNGSLLGMAYLDRFRQIVIRNNTLVLER
jgi:aspartyl protease family protein